MSRTYKKYTGMCYRSPRGRVRALRAGVRTGAVPPDAWDDVAYDKQVWLPYRVAEGLVKNGCSYGYIIHHIQKKFRMRLSDAEWAAEIGEWKKPYIPEGCLAVYDEKRYESIKGPEDSSGEEHLPVEGIREGWTSRRNRRRRWKARSNLA